jgi:oligoribonuclease NrnB/cAMP/cGMP phosphodiesterase (DHH superfamily)
VVSKKHPDAKFIPVNYGDSHITNDIWQDCYENANINDEYIIVDFSFPRDLMIAMNNKAKSMIVIDHHKTAEEICKGLDFCMFNMNESGASLAWEYFFPDKIIPEVVRYVADRDLWRFKLPFSNKINSYIQSFPMLLDSYEYLNSQLSTQHGIDDAIVQGEAIDRYKKTMVETICKNAQIRNIGGYIVPVVNASMLFSEIGEWLCNNYKLSYIAPGLSDTPPFGAYYFDRVKDNVRQWGMRSRGDFDVSVVAKMYGGGGHKAAAGFQEPLNGSILRDSEI